MHNKIQEVIFLDPSGWPRAGFIIRCACFNRLSQNGVEATLVHFVLPRSQTRMLLLCTCSTGWPKATRPPRGAPRLASYLKMLGAPSKCETPAGEGAPSRPLQPIAERRIDKGSQGHPNRPQGVADPGGPWLNLGWVGAPLEVSHEAYATAGVRRVRRRYLKQASTAGQP